MRWPRKIVTTGCLRNQRIPANVTRRTFAQSAYNTSLRARGIAHSGLTAKNPVWYSKGPEFAAEVAEECRRRLEALGDDGLHAVALAKMEGRSASDSRTTC
jgi:hypothetical protein